MSSSGNVENGEWLCNRWLQCPVNSIYLQRDRNQNQYQYLVFIRKYCSQAGFCSTCFWYTNFLVSFCCEYLCMPECNHNMLPDRERRPLHSSRKLLVRTRWSLTLNRVLIQFNKHTSSNYKGKTMYTNPLSLYFYFPGDVPLEVLLKSTWPVCQTRESGGIWDSSV